MVIKTTQISDSIRIEIETMNRTAGALRYCIWVRRGDHNYHYFSGGLHKPLAEVEAAALRAVKRIEKNPDLLSY